MNISEEHLARVEKDRTGRYQDKIIEKPGEALGEELAAWLLDGHVPEPETEKAPQPTGWASWPELAHKKFWIKAGELGLSHDAVHSWFQVESMKDYTGTMQQAASGLADLADAMQTEPEPEPEEAF